MLALFAIVNNQTRGCAIKLYPCKKHGELYVFSSPVLAKIFALNLLQLKMGSFSIERINLNELSDELDIYLFTKEENSEEWRKIYIHHDNAPDYCQHSESTDKIPEHIVSMNEQAKIEEEKEGTLEKNIDISLN